MAAKRKRDGVGHRAYRRKRDALKRRAQREGLACVRCGRPINFDAHHNAADSFTGDHPDALDNGGHLVNQTLGVMHKGCNSSKGAHADTEIWGAT